MRILFKNLEKSEFAHEAVEERLGDLVEKFPRLAHHRITVTLSMENSPKQPGLDAFTVRVLIVGREFSGITLAKTAPTLYLALADVRERMLEILNRAGDRKRVIQRRRERILRSTLAG